MTLSSVQEGIGIAFDSLRANKVRASLTILGIVIGIATVMAMAAMIVGIRTSVTNELDALGPHNFMVERYDQTQLQFADAANRRPPWEGKPRITPEEAELIARLPAVQSVTPSVFSDGEARYANVVLADVPFRGRGYLWPDYSRGEFVRGRNFLPSEEQRGARVAVLSEATARSLFGSVEPLGRSIRLSGEQFQVIGVYQEPANIFSPAGADWITVPSTTAIQRLQADRNWYSLLVVPAAGVSQSVAIDQVTTALRAERGLRPGEENNFAAIRNEALADLFDQITGIFFIVMLVLSSIGLLVGGVGVIAIMTISVTERTREIGVRKALGATRREILWQFLVEAMTVTLIGGIIGICVGAFGALLLGKLTPIPAAVPLWSVAAALAVSTGTGLVFGIYPANRAARLDPVDALHYE